MNLFLQQLKAGEEEKAEANDDDLPPETGSDEASRPRGRRPLAPHLKRRRVEHDLSEEEGATLCAVWAFWATFVVFSVVNKMKSMGVSPAAEEEGLDVPEFGMEAYPEGALSSGARG
ncbi:MAG: hypothetical protein ACR2I2_23340 [Bryobacteraceae bacterium]